MVSNNHCIYLCHHCQYCKYCQRLMSSQEISGDTMDPLRSPEIRWALLISGVSGNSRSRPFPRMKASDSLSWIMGMDFLSPFPFPNFGNAFFFIPFPFPNCGNGFFHSLPVPELWEWIFLIPFPFPNLLFHRRESKRELDYCKRYQASNFFSFLYISQNNYIEEVNWAKMFKSEWLKRQDILLSFVANSFAAKVLVIVNKIILFWFCVDMYFGFFHTMIIV